MMLMMLTHHAHKGKLKLFQLEAEGFYHQEETIKYKKTMSNKKIRNFSAEQKTKIYLNSYKDTTILGNMTRYIKYELSRCMEYQQ